MRMLGNLYRNNAIKMLGGILMLLISHNATAQYHYDWRSHIDFIIQQTDSLSLKSQRTFFLTKYLKNDQPFKETWYYTMKEGKIILFEIRYLQDSIEFSETYYLDRDRLVCMEQYETNRFSFYEDEIKRGKVFLLADNNVKQYVMVGPQHDYHYPWLRMNAAGPLDKFHERFSELKRHLPIVTPR